MHGQDQNSHIRTNQFDLVNGSESTELRHGDVEDVEPR